MYRVEYYTRRNGRCPAAEWRDTLSQKLRTVIVAKIQKLEQYGLGILDTEMLTSIAGNGSDFYELRGGQCRLALYYDRRRSTFVLLHGWLKKGRISERDIDEARRLLHEYLSEKGG